MPEDPKNSFSATEVGVLLEDMNTKIGIIAEAVAPLREDMIEVKERLGRIEFDVRVIKDVIPSMGSRIRKLEARG